MSTEVIVAIVAATAAVVAPVLTWFAARQDATDLRKNINRDIELLQRLAFGTATERLLRQHVARSVRELVIRERRRSDIRIIVRYSLVPYLCLLAFMVIRIVDGWNHLSPDALVRLGWLVLGLGIITWIPAGRLVWKHREILRSTNMDPEQETDASAS